MSLLAHDNEATETTCVHPTVIVEGGEVRCGTCAAPVQCRHSVVTSARRDSGAYWECCVCGALGSRGRDRTWGPAALDQKFAGCPRHHEPSRLGSCTWCAWEARHQPDRVWSWRLPQPYFKRKREEVRVEYLEAGWLSPPNGVGGQEVCCSVLARRTSDRPDCAALVVWRVTVSRGRSRWVVFWCDADLPSEDCPPGGVHD